jgi:hypothetical protein
MSFDMLVERAQQSNASDSKPLPVTVARRCVEERLRSRTRASFRQCDGESPWLMLNRCIAQEEGTTPPKHSWIARQR